MKNRINLPKAISLLILLSGIVYAMIVFSGYVKGQKEYADIKEEYTRLRDDSGTELANAPEENGTSSQRERKKASELNRETQFRQPMFQELPGDAPAEIDVNWQSLLQRNPDVVGWIDIPAVQISYPVVQAQDNDYYLHRGMDGNYLYAGSIFLDACCSSGFYSYNTILYGHNMRDGSMFARLKDFRDPKVLDRCRYFWILTPASDNLYEICSIHPAASGSESYLFRFDEHSSYEEWLRDMTALSDIETGTILVPGDRVVTLSTCADSSSERILLQGRLAWRKDRKTQPE